MTFHVEYPRVQPAQRPDGHEPAAPRWSLRFERPVTAVVSDYLAVQGRELPWEQQRRFFDRVRASFGGEDGPSVHETMRFTDEQGYVNAVLVAYWTEPERHARWQRDSSFAAWFADDARLAEDVGYWRETLVVPYDRQETIYSDPDYRIGLARCAGAVVAATTTNGYFGAARDRLPISAVEPLDGAMAVQRREVPADTFAGRRVRALTPLNLTTIRSGQFWHDADAEQTQDYEDSLQPKLMEGMAYLSEHDEETSTLSLRIMTNLDEEGNERQETSVYAAFASLELLERWAASHQTHLKIFGHAIEAKKHWGDDRQVVTWHEVFVLLPGAGFEYVNCHAQTGLLPYCPLVEAV